MEENPEAVSEASVFVLDLLLGFTKANGKSIYCPPSYRISVITVVIGRVVMVT